MPPERRRDHASRQQENPVASKDSGSSKLRKDAYRSIPKTISGVAKLSRISPLYHTAARSALTSNKTRISPRGNAPAPEILNNFKGNKSNLRICNLIHLRNEILNASAATAVIGNYPGILDFQSATEELNDILHGHGRFPPNTALHLAAEIGALVAKESDPMEARRIFGCCTYAMAASEEPSKGVMMDYRIIALDIFLHKIGEKVGLAWTEALEDMHSYVHRMKVLIKASGNSHVNDVLAPIAQDILDSIVKALGHQPVVDTLSGQSIKRAASRANRS